MNSFHYRLRTSALACCCLLALGANASEGNDRQRAALIPLPQEWSVSDQVFRLSPKTTFGLDLGNEELVAIAQYFNGKIAPALGYELKVQDKGKIRLALVEDTDLGKEGYRLRVTRKGIELTANEPAGIFYGVQTLLQLLPKEIKSREVQPDVDWTIQCGEMVDKPEFPWRGMMLDVSRHWFTKEEVMRFIDELAEYKMNVFHWHLTDDQGWRIEIKSLPRLTEVGAWRAKRVGAWWQRRPQQPGEKATYGGFYTQEDIKEVLEYARRRYVKVVPEVDVPGHSLALLVAYPELACNKAPEAINVGNKFYGIDENTVCAGNERTFEVLEKVFGEVADLFPGEYIHIGGDECFKGFWKKCPKCQQRMKDEGLKDEHELQSYVIRRLEKFLKTKGKKLIGWDEILEGGLAPEATVMSWRGMKGGIEAAKANHHVIMTPTEHCYLDLYQGDRSVEPSTYSICRLTDSYHFDLVPEGVNPKMILGGQGNLWSEAVPTFRHAEYMAWPRGWALAEVFWSGKKHRDWNGFWPRVEKHFERADEAEINYARSMYNPTVDAYLENGELRLKLECELKDSEIYYTFDNTNPDKYTPKYVEPLCIPEGANLVRAVTYRNGKPSGKVITREISDLRKEAEKKAKK